MKHTIGIITLLVMLLMGVTVEAWALSATDIKIDILPAEAKTAGCTVIVNPIGSDGKTVTITVTPSTGYYVKKENVVAYLLAPTSSAAPRRAVPISDPLEITGEDGIKTGATDYSFVVPEGYAGAKVTVTFTQKGVATAVVKANDLTYNQTAQELVTTTVEGGTVRYQVDATGESGFSTDIPTRTTVKWNDNKVAAYKVYYKIVPDAGFSAPAFDATKDYVEVTINPAKLTKVTLEKTVQSSTGSPVTFAIAEVKAGNLTVLATGDDPGYEIKDNSNVKTEVGSYTATVKGKGNYGGEVFATFRIVDGTNVVFVKEDTPKSEISDLTKHYILTCNIEADRFDNLKNGNFTGTFDGDMYTITGILDHPMFENVNGGTVKNVIIGKAEISVNGHAGAIAGQASGASRIYNCGVLDGYVESIGEATDDPKTKNSCGGLVGLLEGTSRVVNCYSYATIKGGNRVGGIVGYNNNTTTAGSITTMIMNCMFYGDITSGNKVSPVYGGNKINNLQGGLNTFNYYAYDKLKTKAISGEAFYNCALAVEEKYLNRFEYYRLLLNSNKKLAAFYATGSANNANQMAKWVLETADRTIANPKPYPVLKRQGYYPSIINPDFENAPDSITVGRNKGGKLGKTLSVTISGSKTDGGQSWPTGASITTGNLTLQRTDKDFDRFNFNYDKVQLPYYNDVGTGNYTGNRVVTGWKITAITAVTGDSYTSDNYPTTGITDFPDHNYADRKSSKKDLYSVSKRVFSQGAYFDVPYGVTSITIEPYWGQAAYIADSKYDVVYKNDYTGKQDVGQTGTQVGSGAEHNSQTIYTSINDDLLNSLTGTTVYDNAIVLVGNLHLNTVPSGGNTPFTMMSVDEDNDHEPDYSLIYHHKSRTAIAPIRFDFLNIPGTAQAQKPNGASLICNFTIFKTKGWFEVTNTSSFYSSQLEYENLDGVTKSDAPLILQGGVIDQFVSTQSKSVTGKTIYIHVGGNVWIKEFGMGTHSDGSQSTPHVPVSVTGGEFPGFYLTGTYNANATARADNAECYISGGYFHEAAGASLEQINGNVKWQIYNADIDNFFGGGINDAKPILGDVTVDIYNSHVKLFCGGPKFGNMFANKEGTVKKKVTTIAEGCTFDKFFGAGYGGTSIAKKKYYDLDSYDWSTLQGYYTTDRGKYYDGSSTPASQISGKDYGKKGPGVATDFDYEFFVWSSGKTGARLFVKFASFSLAQCNDVESTLKECTINGDYYGGGSLGKVVGTATSILDGCTVYGNVFGGGYSASLPQIEVRKAGFKVTGQDSEGNDIYAFPNFNSSSGMFEPGEFSDVDKLNWKKYVNANNANEKMPSNGGVGIEKDGDVEKYVYTDVDLTTLGQVAHTNLTIRNNTFVQGKIVEGKAVGGVFGGGDESAVNGTTTVNIENIGTRTICNVYGGGNRANVVGDTEVNLKDGTINGNVFGGGRGDADHYATVGNTLVKLNEPVVKEGETTYPYNCIVKESIFGCNDINGTPTGNATVHIYKTAGDKPTKKEDLDDPQDSKHKYQLKAVYGGGNLAAYIPDAADATTHVIIDGCDMTSIKQVYGGGNAASTPATKVEVNGTYEIEELFGGGNGKDDLPDGRPNPGANVGYYNYSTYNTESDKWVDNTDADTKEKRQRTDSPYLYGTGEANVRIYGGLVHRVFGGSNTLGNVRKTALTLLDGQEDCEFKVDEAYGGGKSAPMDGAAHLEMACIPGLKAAYGGAEEANILNDVTLNITNGTFDRVFGGNNVQGTISGKITVNIEETGCRPIIIGQLYGGGNQAPYTASDGETGPTLNIRSFTSIGDVFGGGYGKTAVVTGNTTVDINVCEGKFFDKETQSDLGKTTIRFTEYERDDNGDFVLDGDNNRTSKTVNLDIYQPPHTAGQIGAINNVFGGGNAAKVIGNTNVNIGTKIGEMVNVVSLPIKDSADREPSDPAWVPTYEQKEVKGVNIIGNVYGGGNEADVTGSTNVTIGKETTTTTTSAPPVTPEPTPTP